MPDLRFIEAVQDATLIPAIYDTCDQWCQYCPATARCLAFRLSSARSFRPDALGDILEAMRASMAFLKECHEAEGKKPPDELLRLLNDPPAPIAEEMVDDPLERMGRRYAIMAAAYLASSGDVPREIPARPDGPTPYEVFLFYHLPIAAKIYRAIISARAASRGGGADARYDADVSAKVALIGIDRSDEALQVLTVDDRDPRIPHMRGYLSHLRRAVEARFPEARTLVRPGLD